MIKSLAADISGAADVCRPLRDLSKSIAVDYIVPGETILFTLQSAKEEFAFTNQAVVASVGESATTTRKLVTRYDYKSNTISHVEFETAGRVDRDCEIKFHIGGKHISIDVAKAEEPTAQIYYKVLELLSRAQQTNARNWDLAKTSMGHAAEALRLSEASGYTLTRQSDEAMVWLQTLYDRFNPRCYREVIVAAMRDVQTAAKFNEP